MCMKINLVERDAFTVSLNEKTFYNIVEDNCTKNWTYKPHVKLY
jgi:hypothetical protein